MTFYIQKIAAKQKGDNKMTNLIGREEFKELANIKKRNARKKTSNRPVSNCLFEIHTGNLTV